MSLGNPYTILLAKENKRKRIFKTDSELSQNCAEKQIMPSKTTTNWLFNDIWCYLFIACFDWKIGIFQKTVVRVCYILNCNNKTSALPPRTHPAWDVVTTSHLGLIKVGTSWAMLLRRHHDAQLVCELDGLIWDVFATSHWCR